MKTDFHKNQVFFQLRIIAEKKEKPNELKSNNIVFKNEIIMNSHFYLDKQFTLNYLTYKNMRELKG